MRDDGRRIIYGSGSCVFACVLCSHYHYWTIAISGQTALSVSYCLISHLTPPHLPAPSERSVVFASESQLDMTKWMNKMGLSAIAYDSSASFTTGGFSRPDRDAAPHVGEKRMLMITNPVSAN